jgi:glycosyltransferase involved in cell wall biosynthesis
MRICAITPHQLLSNPRIVKEADALAAGGHEVRVIAVQKRPDDRAVDESLARGRPWRLQNVDIERMPGSRWRWFVTGARQRAATMVWRGVRHGTRLAGLAYGRTFTETLRLLVAEPTDLIIAHTQPMLAPAWFAAEQLGCRWGFDCEDILSEEDGEGIADPRHQALVRAIEAAFIPHADYVTVASPEFGPWLARRYGVRSPRFVANVPPLAEAPPALVPGFPDARPHLDLYWFSMSIGPRRGLEDALRALPLLTVPAKLHIRGRMLPGYRQELGTLVRELDLSDRVVVHELVAPDEVVRAAAGHDIGLVLSQPCCENHEMWAPNKLYAYLMAGLAIGATATRGHRAVLAAAPGTGFEYAPGDPVQLADAVNQLAREPTRLRECREAAFQIARARLNWEREQRQLLDIVDSLAPRPVQARAWQAARA